MEKRLMQLLPTGEFRGKGVDFGLRRGPTPAEQFQVFGPPAFRAPVGGGEFDEVMICLRADKRVTPR